MVKKKILDYFASLKRPDKGRKYPRLKAFNLIKFRTADGKQYESISNIIDISENGLQFTCYEELRPGQDIHMVVHVPHAEKEVSITARLVWLRPSRTRGLFIAGVQFGEITEENKHLIRQMIQGPAPKR